MVLGDVAILLVVIAGVLVVAREVPVIVLLVRMSEEVVDVEEFEEVSVVVLVVAAEVLVVTVESLVTVRLVRSLEELLDLERVEEVQRR